MIPNAYLWFTGEAAEEEEEEDDEDEDDEKDGDDEDDDEVGHPRSVAVMLTVPATDAAEMSTSPCLVLHPCCISIYGPGTRGCRRAACLIAVAVSCALDADWLHAGR